MAGSPYDVYGNPYGQPAYGGGMQAAGLGQGGGPAPFQSDYGAAHKFAENVPIFGSFLDNSTEKDAIKRSQYEAQNRLSGLRQGYGQNPLSRVGENVYGAIDQAQTPTLIAANERAAQSLATSYAARGLAGRSGAGSAGQAGLEAEMGYQLGGMRGQARGTAINAMAQEQTRRSQEEQAALGQYYQTMGMRGGDSRYAIGDAVQMAGAMIGTGGGRGLVGAGQDIYQQYRTPPDLPGQQGVPYNMPPPPAPFYNQPPGPWAPRPGSGDYVWGR